MVASLHGVVAILPAVIGVHGGVDKLIGRSGLLPVDLTYICEIILYYN